MLITKIAALEIMIGQALVNKTPYPTKSKQATELTILSVLNCFIAKEVSKTAVAI
jgi:hypothetical protein